MKKAKSCVVCKKLFVSRKKNSKYCSLTCAHKNRPFRTSVCKNCKKIFNYQSIRIAKYCGRKCSYTHYRKIGLHDDNRKEKERQQIEREKEVRIFKNMWAKPKYDFLPRGINRLLDDILRDRDKTFQESEEYKEAQRAFFNKQKEDNYDRNT